MSIASELDEFRDQFEKHHDDTMVCLALEQKRWHAPKRRLASTLF